jgi:hypothetical protein
MNTEQKQLEIKFPNWAIQLEIEFPSLWFWTYWYLNVGRRVGALTSDYYRSPSNILLSDLARTIQ